MTYEPTSTARAQRLRARCAKGIAMVAPVEVGEGGVELLVANGLLKQADRQAVSGRRVSRPSSSGPGAVAHGPRDRVIEFW